MGIFNRKINKRPIWASCFTDKEYTAFLASIDAYFRQTLEITYEIQDGVIVPGENDFGFEHLGLDNLVRHCKMSGIDDYSGIVATHFNDLIGAYEFQKDFEKIKNEFDQVRKYIAVRIYDIEYMSSIGMEYFVYEQLADDLFAVLVFDFPYSISNIKQEQIVTWGKSADELFELGLENVRRNYETKVETVEFGPEKEKVFTCEAEHLFVTNILFELEAKNGFIGQGGSLVAAPNRNLLLVYPINDLKIIGIINSLCLAVSKTYDDNPGSLSKNIYWYKAGKFLTLPYEIKKKKLFFTPPDAFVDLLNSLEK